jgi:hypothetical protein
MPQGTSAAFQSTERRHTPLAALTMKSTSDASKEVGRESGAVKGYRQVPEGIQQDRFRPQPAS